MSGTIGNPLQECLKEVNGIHYFWSAFLCYLFFAIIISYLDDWLVVLYGIGYFISNSAYIYIYIYIYIYTRIPKGPSEANQSIVILMKKIT